MFLLSFGGIRTNSELAGVVVSYTQDPDIQTGKKFAGVGLQIAAGVR